jgi:DNA modification methylase
MFKPKVLLDFTMGWGGRLVGACALDIDKYIGIDLNKQLRTPYKMMAKELNKMSHTSIELYFENAVNFDYSKLDYDMVFTSPPYYNIEIYKGTKKRSIDEWNNDFYIPLFSNTFKYLKHKGIYALNVNKEIYENVCIPILGKSYKKIPLQLSKRGNDYKEFIYIWKK